MSEELPPLDPKLRALFDREAEAPFVSPGMAERIRAGVMAGIPPPPAPAAPSGSAPPTGGLASAALGSPLGAAVVSTALLVGALLGRVTAPPAPVPPAQAVSPAPAPPAPSPVESAIPAAPVVPPTPPPVEPAAQKTPASIPPRPLHDLAAEQLLLDRARVALSRRLPKDALEAVREHERRFPKGALAPDRAALLVIALEADGQHESARIAAEQYLQAYPDGLMSEAVRAIAERP